MTTPPDAEMIREELARTDPEYARVRRALHDGRNLQQATRAAERLRQRRIDMQMEAWRRDAPD